MKISVVIPAFNEERLITRCLTALLSQTTKPNEIIVVDNNSTDKTAALAQKLGVGVVSEKKQGMIYARNRGFNSASHEIIARCDADAMVPDFWVDRIKKNFKKTKIDALTGPVIYIDSPFVIQSHIPSRIYLESMRFLSLGKRFLMGPNMIVTRQMWKKVKDKVNLDDKKVHEDIDLSLKILKAGGNIGYDKSLIVQSSARRIVGKPESFFLEYPTRVIKTFWANRN